jgi:hypothetical protein
VAAASAEAGAPIAAGVEGAAAAQCGAGSAAVLRGGERELQEGTEWGCDDEQGRKRNE